MKKTLHLHLELVRYVREVVNSCRSKRGLSNEVFKSAYMSKMKSEIGGKVKKGAGSEW